MTGAEAPFDPDQEERADLCGRRRGRDRRRQLRGAAACSIFRPGDRITVRATRRARLMFLGGTAMEGPRYIWWNFVSSQPGAHRAGQGGLEVRPFGPVPGETEFIPLPS